MGFNVTRASKEEAKKIFDLFAGEGALFRLSPIVVPLVPGSPLKPLFTFSFLAFNSKGLIVFTSQSFCIFVLLLRDLLLQRS